jgi:hypothetical protein
MTGISAERGLIRAFYPEHVSCLGTADPTQDPEWGLVCNGCGTILGFPGQPGEAEQPPAREPVDSGETEPNDQDPAEAGYVAEPLVANPVGRVGTDSTGVEWTAPPDTSDEEMREHGVEPNEPVADDPPWDDPQTRLIAHEPVINDMPPTEEEPLPDPHGSVAKSAVKPQDPIMAALDVIDPSRPYTPVEVEAQLVDLEGRLERGQHFQRVWEERAYRTKLAFTMAYEADLVRIYEETKAPQDIRQAQARTENKTLYEDMTLAEMMVRAVRESMHNLRSQLSGYQSIAKSVGASMTGHGYRT